MNLFFETSNQSISFLSAVPIGLMLALLLDGSKSEGIFRTIMDVCFILAAGAAMMVMLIFLQDEMLRMYHLLGLLSGCILYLCGLGRIRRSIVKGLQNRNRCSTDEAESS